MKDVVVHVYTHRESASIQGQTPRGRAYLFDRFGMARIDDISFDDINDLIKCIREKTGLTFRVRAEDAG